MPVDDLYQAAFDELSAQYENEEESNETSDVEVPDDGGSTPEEGAETPPTETPSSPESEDPVVEVAGLQLKASEIEELVRLRQFLDSDTQSTIVAANQAMEQARQQAAAVSAANTQPPAYVPPTAPEDLELESPTVRALWERLSLIEQMSENQRQELLRRQAVDTSDQVERAVTDWNNKYHLSDDQIKLLRTRAAETGIAATVASNGKSVYEGVNSALEAAFWSDSTLRNQYLLAAAEQSKKTEAADKTKQRKLSALSGRTSSTSQSRPPAQMTAQERTAAMTAELADILNNS